MTLPSVIHQTNGKHASKYAGRLDTVALPEGLAEIKGLQKAEKELLRDMVEQLPPGLLGRIDTHAVKVMLDWHRIARKTRKLFEADLTDTTKRLAAVAAQDRFLAMARQLGLTPHARAGMRAPEPQEDAFEIIMERLTE